MIDMMGDGRAQVDKVYQWEVCGLRGDGDACIREGECMHFIHQAVPRRIAFVGCFESVCEEFGGLSMFGDGCPERGSVEQGKAEGFYLEDETMGCCLQGRHGKTGLYGVDGWGAADRFGEGCISGEPEVFYKELCKGQGWDDKRKFRA